MAVSGEIVFVVVLWKERNCRTFGRSASPSLLVIQAAFSEGEEWAMAGFAPFSVISALRSQRSTAM